MIQNRSWSVGICVGRVALANGKPLRVGTMDLKIGAICLAHDTLLLTRNTVEFRRIPDLQVENWLD